MIDGLYQLRNWGFGETWNVDLRYPVKARKLKIGDEMPSTEADDWTSVPASNSTSPGEKRCWLERIIGPSQVDFDVGHFKAFV